MPCLYIRVCLIDESLNAPAMTALVSLGLARDQDSDFPFPMDRNDSDTFHAAYTQYPHPANRLITQAEIENHHPSTPLRDIYGGSGVSASPDSSSSMTANASSSSSTELYAQSGIQDDYVGTTSFSHGQVDGIILSLAATQQQNAATRKKVWKRQQKQRKNERDKVRKRIQRSDDDQYFAMICELLDIPLGPKNTLVRRSEYLCIHLFRLSGIESFIVLEGVGELVEQRKLDEDLQDELLTIEADTTAKRARPLVEAGSCSYLPTNAYSALDA
jgi:hypothetical protein